MENKLNMELEMIAKDENESIDMVTMFDDCESGFLAKNEKLITWLLS